MTVPRRLVIALAVGVLAGVGGIAITLALHATQRLLFGYDGGTFLQGIESAPDWRRVAGAALGGLAVGLGWAWLRRRGRPTTVSEAISDGARLPIAATGLDALLQAVAVGGGASVGREGAPRQLGAGAGAQLADRLGLDPADRRVLIAAGAGGGLAAVYNVPVAGVIFAASALTVVVAADPRPGSPSRRARVLARPGRVLARLGRPWPHLRTVDWAVLVVVNGLATVTAWTVLGTARVYSVPDTGFDAGSLTALAVWSLLAAPPAAAVAIGLNVVARRAMSRQPTGWVRLPAATTAAMGLVGLAAVWFPTLPGNGKGVVELTLDAWTGMRQGVLLDGTDLTGLPAAATFLVLVGLKIGLTGACLRAGIIGGLLTPALSIGAALGAGVAVLAATFGAPASVADWALVGAAAVLSVSHRNIVFAVVMTWELTGMPWPVAIAAVVAALLARWCARAVGRG